MTITEEVEPPSGMYQADEFNSELFPMQNIQFSLNLRDDDSDACPV